MKMIYVFWLLIFSLLACNPSGLKEQITNSKSDTFKSDIAKDSTTNKSTIFNDVMAFRDVIGTLDTLENGYNGIEFRLWYEMRPLQIIVIKHQQKWTAEMHTITIIPSDTLTSSAIGKREVKKSAPKMGWDKFIDSLNKLQIYTLPNGNSFPGMLNANTGAVNIEVATKGLYRFYSYQAPRYFVDKFDEARKIEAILKLIEDELGFKSGETI